MSVGPLGTIASLAATPLAQAKGADIDKTASDTNRQQRQVDAGEKADAAAGIGRTEEESATSDRDADGRRPWELGPPESAAETGDSGDASEPRSKDPSGLTGGQLDLSG